MHLDLISQEEVKDSLMLQTRSVQQLLTKDSTKVYHSPIEDIISYPALDSTIYNIQDQSVEMFGEARVDYQEISLEADYIQFDFRSMEVLAYGITDTAGIVQGRPVFSEGGNTFKCDTIRYNFDSEQGLISGVITNDGESYVHAELAKKHEDGTVHNSGGMYTTCNLENPHYHFRFNKMIVIPDDKIVTGPIYMKVRTIPLPLGLPFGYFPNTTKQKAGILIPGYGRSTTLGYFLLNGGYYLPINEHLDNQITGDIYSRGSWALLNKTRYLKKYAYSGNVDLSYNKQLQGDPDLLDFSKTSNFFIRWNHSQDSKARPGTTFSANVNAGTSNNFRNNYNSSQYDYINNTLTSGVNYSRRWRTSQLTTSLRHNQNTSTDIINFTLPQIGFNLNRFFLPLSFLRRNSAGPKKAYETIGITYSSSFENRLNTSTKALALNQYALLSKQMVNGVNHNVQANTSMKMGYFNLNPSFRLNERWHFARLNQFAMDTVLVKDTIQGFFSTRDYSMRADLNTKIYGMFSFKNSKVKAIRHVITPSLGFSYTPEIDYRKSVIFEEEELIYNPFTVSAYSQGAIPESAAVNFSMQNSLEMKVRSDSDSTKSTDKKVKLIENYSINTSYNMIADSLNLADIRMTARTTLFKKAQIQYNGTFSPYQVDDQEKRIDRFIWSGPGPLLRGSNHSVAFSTSLSGGHKTKKSTEEQPDSFAKKDELQEVRQNPSAFTDFNIPWNLSFSYTANVGKQYQVRGDGSLNDTTLVTQHGLLFRGDVRLFKKWMLGFSSGYDVKNGDWTSTVLNLSWDLHCWSLSAVVIPFGDRQSYNISLGVKASALQDLKIQKRGNLGNGQGLLF